MSIVEFQALQGETANPSLRRSVTPAEARTLQTQADAACHCARDAETGDAPGSRCWAEFYRSLAPFNHYSMSSACGEESVSLECIGGSDGFAMPGTEETCIFRQRPFASCSAGEERSRRAEAEAGHQSGCSD